MRGKSLLPKCAFGLQTLFSAYHPDAEAMMMNAPINLLMR